MRILCRLSKALVCVGFVSMALPANAENMSRPVIAYAQPGEQDLIAVKDLADSFFLTMQSSDLETALFGSMNFDESTNLGALLTAARTADEICGKWKSISEGETRIMAANAIRREYYVISDICFTQMTFTFIKTDNKWGINGYNILAPSNEWK